MGARNDEYRQSLRIASFWCGGFHPHPRPGHEHERVACTHQQLERARKCQNHKRDVLDKVIELTDMIELTRAEIAEIKANAKAYDAQLHPCPAPAPQREPEPLREPAEQLELEPINAPALPPAIDPGLLAAVLAAVAAYHAGRT